MNVNTNPRRWKKPFPMLACDMILRKEPDQVWRAGVKIPMQDEGWSVAYSSPKARNAIAALVFLLADMNVRYIGYSCV